MKAINLEQYQHIEVPKTKEQLAWSLSNVVSKLGASRFAYVKMPENRDLLKLGVFPRILTNYPQIVIDKYRPMPDTPFNLSQRAIWENRHLYFRDATDLGDLEWYKLCQLYGIAESIVTPIDGSKNAVMIYGFTKHFERQSLAIVERMKQIAALVNMVVKSRPGMCSPFYVPGLTPRTLEVLNFKVRGLTNEQVARELGVKENTVKKTISRFSDKMGGLSTVELVYTLAKMGLL